MYSQTAHRTTLLSLLFTLLVGCAAERPAEPGERTTVLEAASGARAALLSHKVFRRSGISTAPEVDQSADIVTDDDGNSFLYRSDSIIGTVDSLSAEFLFSLRERDSLREGMVRIEKIDGVWKPDGLFLKAGE